MDFFNSFKDLFETHTKSYIVDKIVMGRMPDLIPIKILGSTNGLRGFIDSNGSSIELKDDMWMGMNIRFNSQTEVDRHVNEELERLFKKNKI